MGSLQKVQRLSLTAIKGVKICARKLWLDMATPGKYYDDYESEILWFCSSKEILSSVV
jgi:hypothetical protein